MEASPIQHGHVPLVSKLESRLAIVESEHEDIERALLVTREKIEAFVNRSRKRANMNNGDELRAQVKEIDTKLTTTSMKLVEEKKLLRKKEHLKARLKDIASIESSLQEHLQLKEKRSALMAERREKTVQITEIRQGLKRLNLAICLGVPARDLVAESVDVPRESIGRVLGKRRATLAQLEEECQVTAVEHFSSNVETHDHATPSRGENAMSADDFGSGASGSGYVGADTLTLRLNGTREGVMEALRRLDLVIRTTDAVVEAPPPLAAALRADRHALAHRLEVELRVKIFVTSVGEGGNAGDGDDLAGGVAGRSGSGGGRHRSSTENVKSVSGGTSSGSAKETMRTGRGGKPGGMRGGATASATTTPSILPAAMVYLSGLPEDVEAARLYLAQLDCSEAVVDVERKSFPAIFGPGGTNLHQMQSDFGVVIQVPHGGPPQVVIAGVRQDVEAAASRVQEISQEFRETEERWPVNSCEVRFILHNQGAELRGIIHRVGGGVIMTIVNNVAVPASAPAVRDIDVTKPSASEKNASKVEKSTPTQDTKDTQDSQEATAAVHVSVRGILTKVSTAGAILRERLEVAQHLTAKLTVSADAMPTFVGLGGSSIRKLRQLCLGCDLELSPVVNGVVEIFLLARDESALAYATGLVKKWVRHQQLRDVHVGSEVSSMLKSHRAAGIRARIAGADRRLGASARGQAVGSGRVTEAAAKSGGGGSSLGARDGVEQELFGGARMEILLHEGLVRLRGGDEALDNAERLLREFQMENCTAELPVGPRDEDALLRRGLLRYMQGERPDVHFHYYRDRRAILVRGRAEVVESAATLLQAMLYGGGLDDRGMTRLSVSLVALSATGMKLLSADGFRHLKKLSTEIGVEMEMITVASLVRIRAHSPDKVREAKRSLLEWIGTYQTEIFVDLDRIGSGSGRIRVPSGEDALEDRAVDRDGGLIATGERGSGGNNSDRTCGDARVTRRNSRGGVAKMASNEALRRTVELHGCVAEFVSAVALSSSGAAADDKADCGGTAVAAQNKTSSVNHKSKRSDVRGGGGASDRGDDRRLTGTTSAEARTPPRRAGSRGVWIRGVPGLVESASQAVVALALGQEEIEIVVGAEVTASLDATAWSNFENSSDATVVRNGSRGSIQIRGLPAAVGVCRQELYTILGTAFPGRFETVAMPREALHEVASPLSLAEAASTASTLPFGEIRTGGIKDRGIQTAAAATAAVAAMGGLVGRDFALGGWRGEGDVQLLADWPYSCVRAKGDPRAVQVALRALNASLKKWSALEVTAPVEEWMVQPLYGKQGKAIKKLSQNLGGIILKVRDGVCRGRATSLEAAMEGRRKLEDRIHELRARRVDTQGPREATRRPSGRGNPNTAKGREKAGARFQVDTLTGKEQTGQAHPSERPAAVDTAKQEETAMTERPQQSYSAGESVKIPCRFVDAFVRGPDASAIRSMAATGRAEIRAEDGSGKLVVSGTEEAVMAAKKVLQVFLDKESIKEHRHTRNHQDSDPRVAAQRHSGGGSASADEIPKVESLHHEVFVGGDEPDVLAAEVDTTSSCALAETSSPGKFVDGEPIDGCIPLRPMISLPSSDHAQSNASIVDQDSSICFGSYETPSGFAPDRSSPAKVAVQGNEQERVVVDVALAADRADPGTMIQQNESMPSRRAGSSLRLSEATESEANRLFAKLLLVDKAESAAAAAASSSGTSTGRTDPTGNPKTEQHGQYRPQQSRRGLSSGRVTTLESKSLDFNIPRPLEPTRSPSTTWTSPPLRTAEEGTTRGTVSGVNTGEFASPDNSAKIFGSTGRSSVIAPQSTSPTDPELAPACGTAYFTMGNGISVRL